MLFSSIIFIAYFLPVFLAVYYLSGLRTAVLLTGSVAFYVWGEGPYIALLAALIVVALVGVLNTLQGKLGGSFGNASAVL